MPFALGQRMCIGQRFAMLEMKIILAHIFRNFTIRSMDKECDIEVTIDMTLKSVNPIRITFIAID
ncbi:Cytochrome P450 4V2-like protein [Leptotrombidium deliense]|uniref:Cholesterol side-chain cleavage enzyme, mitochondrial n=1 Tax=Leptotrombidium deliense TaxID=299467 RepID=A0A443RVW2_9ACAR|nr:Cytochrome P450 4V2-like protein [Leptotrombidium deliense]